VELGKNRKNESAANSEFFVRPGLDRSAPIFRLALMGADEEDQTKSDSFEALFSEGAVEKLSDGWRIASLPDGQLLLLGPPRYGEPPKAA
jgi:hypothetical protein